MEFLIVTIVLVAILIFVKKMFDINYKKIKNVGKNEHLDEITQKYPKNIEICKWYLRKLNNENVLIEENEDMQNCLYIAITNKILIANVSNTYTRIQTIAHECLHSIQGKKLLLFNFIFSNIYLMYTIAITILAIFKILPNPMMFLSIQLIFTMVYLLVRTYLENDAMIKARYLSKEYMEEQKISTPKEIEEIIKEYDKINPIGIKATNYQLFFNACIKIILFSLICFIRIVAF